MIVARGTSWYIKESNFSQITKTGQKLRKLKFKKTLKVIFFPEIYSFYISAADSKQILKACNIRRC